MAASLLVATRRVRGHVRPPAPSLGQIRVEPGEVARRDRPTAALDLGERLPAAVGEVRDRRRAAHGRVRAAVPGRRRPSRLEQALPTESAGGARRATLDRRRGKHRDRELGHATPVPSLSARGAAGALGAHQPQPGQNMGRRQDGCRRPTAVSTIRGSRSVTAGCSPSGPRRATAPIRIAHSDDNGGHWAKATVAQTTSTPFGAGEGYAGLPDIGASGDNVALAWIATDTGIQRALTSATGGDDFVGATPLPLTGRSPNDRQHYPAVGGAADPADPRVAIAYSTRTSLELRTYDGVTLGAPSVVFTWGDDDRGRSIRRRVRARGAAAGPGADRGGGGGLPPQPALRTPVRSVRQRLPDRCAVRRDTRRRHNAGSRPCG